MGTQKSRKRLEKILIKEDGTQIPTQIGLVDKNGVMLLLVDGSTAYLKFSPLNTIIADLETEKRDLEDELEMAYTAFDEENRKADGLTRLCADLFEYGIFDRERRVQFMNRYYKFRNKVS